MVPLVCVHSNECDARIEGWRSDSRVTDANITMLFLIIFVFIHFIRNFDIIRSDAVMSLYWDSQLSAQVEKADCRKLMDYHPFVHEIWLWLSALTTSVVPHFYSSRSRSCSSSLHFYLGKFIRLKSVIDLQHLLLYVWMFQRRGGFLVLWVCSFIINERQTINFWK